MVWAAAYKTKNKFAGGLVLWQSKGDTYGANMKYMIIVYTMLNSSGEFPNPAFGIGGVFDSYAECQGGLLERQTQKHVMRKNDDNKHVLFSNDGEYIWVESCVPSLG